MKYFSKVLLVLVISFYSVFATDSSSQLKISVQDNTATDNSLSYFYSEGLSLDLPNGVVLSLNWDYKGHGDVLAPFKGIKPIISKKTSNSDSNEFSVKEATKLLLTNIAATKAKKFIDGDLDEYLKNLPSSIIWFAKRIVKNGRLTPAEEFLLKSYLLYVTPLDAGYENLKIAEQVALFVKFVRSDLFDDLGSTFVLENLVNYFEPEFLEFLLEVAFSFKDGFQDYDFDEIEVKKEEPHIVGYLFKNKEIARQCYDSINAPDKVSINKFKNSVETIVTNRKGIYASPMAKIVSVTDFETYKNSSFDFVGFKDFGQTVDPAFLAGINGELNNGLHLISKSDTDHWVILVGLKDNFAALNLLKYTVAALGRALHEYKQISKFDYKESFKEIDVALLKDKKESLEQKQVKLENKIKKLNAKIKKYSAPRFFFFGRPKDKSAADNAEMKKVKSLKKFDSVKRKLSEIKAVLFSSDVDVLLAECKNKGIKEVFGNIFLKDHRILKIYNDVRYNSDYKIIKNNLIKRLALVSAKSDVIKEYWPTIEYILLNSLPLYETEIKKFGQELNADLNIADLLVNLIN